MEATGGRGLQKSSVCDKNINTNASNKKTPKIKSYAQMYRLDCTIW